MLHSSCATLSIYLVTVMTLFNQNDMYALEAVSLPSVNCHVMENCTNRALCRIYGCDNLEFLRSCIGLDYVEVLS